MTFFNTAEFKVGALVIIVGSLIAFMSMQVSDDPSYLGRSKKTWFLLPNASGLIKNSAVKSAGIPVGVIKDIRLQDGKARIDITVKADVGLTTSARVEIKAQGILGDMHVEIYPGNFEDPPLPDGAQITTVKDGGSLDNVVKSISEISGSVKDVAEKLRESISEDGTRQHVLGRIVKNIEKLTGDLAEMTGDNKQKIGEIVDQVHEITDNLNKIVKDEGDEGIKKAVKRIAATAKNLEEITDKVNRGEGTIGKLIHDDTTVEELNTAIQGVNNMLDTASKTTTAFDFQGQYLSKVTATKSYIGVRIQPGLDRYYYLAIVDDPSGVIETTQTVTSGTSTGDVTERKTSFNRTKLTALFAKNFWDLTVKAGFIETSGGFGIDYHFFKRKLKYSLEFFDFDQLNVRSSLSYSLPYGLYLSLGINDALNKSGQQSEFIGAGLFLTNDDLKLLLTKAPF